MLFKKRISTTQEIDDVLELDVDEGRPLEFWERKQRELLTNQVDYGLRSLADLVDRNGIDLNPKFQRRLRWDIDRQSKLIESFLMNVPVPPIYLNEDEFGKYSVIDGKQRLTAISDFIHGRLRLTNLEVFRELNGKTFQDLPTLFRNAIETRPNLRAVIVLKQSDKDVKLEVFKRLNTGGVRLNAQELRNAAFEGRLNSLIMTLSESKDFHSLLGISNKHLSSMYQEMRDAELVLRFATFRNTWESFAGGMKISMDNFAEENKDMPQTQVDMLKLEFTTTLKAVQSAFGEHAFKRWVPERSVWRKQVLVSLYDAQMFACFGLNPVEIAPFQSKIIAGTKDLFDDDAFRLVIDAATNTPSSFKSRVKMMKQLIKGVMHR